MITRDRALRIAFMGDVALGNHPKAPGIGFYSRYADGIPHSLIERVLPAGPRPDIVFGNLEFALASDLQHPGTTTCCLGSDRYIGFLVESGFSVLNVANNHAWEHGENLFWHTVTSLKQAGIKVVGIPDDFDPAQFLHFNGRTIAILGCSARPRQGFAGPPGYNEFDERKFLSRIRDARMHANLVCVSIHWGEEFLGIPSQSEKDIARAMIDAGASVVVGHHPHVLREVESWQNGIIAYSLGNFVGDMTWNPSTRETGCLIVDVDASCGVSSNFVPAEVGWDYFPHYLDKSQSKRFLRKQRKLHEDLYSKLARSSYDVLAQRALKWNAWLTLGFFLRNIFRYRISTLAGIVIHGVAVRLRKNWPAKI